MDMVDLLTSTLETFPSLKLYNKSDAASIQHLSTAAPPGNGQPPDQCTSFLYVFYVIFASAVGVIGLLGNCVSYSVLFKDKTSPVASFQLRSLAVADNIFLLIWLINYSFRYALQLYGLLDGSYLRTTWIYIRIVTFPVLYMAQSGTIWLTMVVAFNRYVAVCLPYRAHQFGNMAIVRRQVLAVAIGAVIYNIPRLFELKVVDDGEGSVRVNRTELGSNVVYKIIYTDTLYYLLTFVLPLVTLACMNTRVIVTYREACKRRRKMSSRSSQDQEQSITLVMIIIVVVFLACQTLARIVQMVWSYRVSHCHQVHYYLIHVSNVLEVLNSSFNFFIYSAFYKQFRSTLRSGLCCCCPGVWTRGADYDDLREASAVGGGRRRSVNSNSREIQGHNLNPTEQTDACQLSSL